MDCPAERYTPSTRPYTGLSDLDYPFHDKAVIVTTCGRIRYNRRKINLSLVFAGQTVGIKQVEDHIWLTNFMDYDWDTSMMRHAGSNHSKTHSGPVLPMSPV
ncbi:transposase [Mesorhizobium sp. RCC_202]